MLALLAAPCATECRAQNRTPVVVRGNIVTGQDVPPASQSQSGSPDGSGKPARRTLGSIKGRVVGDAGEPLPGVVVYASSRAFNSNSYNYDTRSQHAATSDD